MARARIGIIGAGFWAASFYLPFLARQDDADCIGIVQPDSRIRRALAAEHGLEVATEHVAELLAAGCDGVIVASPNHLHAEHAEAALRAGAHVLVEKPMTVTLADAQRIATLAEDTGLTLALAHGFNYSRMARWAREVVDEGRIGAVRWVNGQMASSLLELFSGRQSYGVMDVGGAEIEARVETWTAADAGGGYMYGQLSHQLGLALWLIDAAPEEVFARLSLLESGVDIDATLSVRFDGGAIGSFSGHGRLPWNVRYPMELVIVGDEGVLSLDFERERADVNLRRDVDLRWSDEPDQQHAFAGGAPDLALELAPGDGLYDNDGPTRLLIDACLGHPERNRSPAGVGVRAVAILEAALRSARAGQPVPISVA